MICLSLFMFFYYRFFLKDFYFINSPIEALKSPIKDQNSLIKTQDSLIKLINSPIEEILH